MYNYSSYDAKTIEIICNAFGFIQGYSPIQKAKQKEKGDFYHSLLAYIFNEAKGYESAEDYIKDMDDIIEDAFWYVGPDWYEDNGYQWEKESHWYWEE